MLASSYKNCIKSTEIIMIKINKEIFKKALLAGIFSAFTIGVLTVLTYKSALGLFIAGSFGSSMVLLFGFPESPFAQPKNVFFGHLVTSIVGVLILKFLPVDLFLQIAVAVGLGIFVMILLGVTHPPAGGNPIVIILGAVSYDFLLNPIIFGSIIIIAYAIILNRFILKKNYPSSWKSWFKIIVVTIDIFITFFIVFSFIFLLINTNDEYRLFAKRILT